MLASCCLLSAKSADGLRDAVKFAAKVVGLIVAAQYQVMLTLLKVSLESAQRLAE
jgi:hypothetical protein